MNPSIYYSQLKAEEEKKCAEEKAKCEKVKNELESRSLSYPDSWAYRGTGVVLFCFIFFPCGMMIEYGLGGGDGMMMLAGLVIGGAIGVGLFALYHKREDSVYAFNCKITKKQEEKDIICQQNIKQIQQETEEKYQQYLKNYEQKAQEKSVDFATSELAQEIIEWITDGFCRTIDAADRRPHVKTIDVPFEISVLADQVL